MNSIVSPFFADVMLGLMYLVVAIALGVTAYSVWHGLRNRRKGDDVINRVPAGRIGWCVAIPTPWSPTVSALRICCG